MNKVMISLHMVLVLVFALHLHFLWAKLAENPSEQVRLEGYRLDPPPVFRTALKEAYRPLFDIQSPAGKSGGIGNRNKNGTSVEKPGEAAGKNGQDRLDTRRGVLRLKAVFITTSRRLALLETSSGASRKYAEIRENEQIHGYRVIEIAAGHVRLRPEQGGETIRLVIFDRERNLIVPRQRQGQETSLDKGS